MPAWVSESASRCVEEQQEKEKLRKFNCHAMAIHAMKFMKNHENRRILNTHANRTRTGYNSTLQAVVHIIGTVHILHDAALFYKYHKAENIGRFHKIISMRTIRPTDKAKGLLQIQWSKQYVVLAVILSSAYNQVGCKEKEYNNEMNLKTSVQLIVHVVLQNSNIFITYTVKRLRSSSSLIFSPRLPMKRVLQGGLSLLFYKKVI